jgi:hypothetical protein
MFQECSHAQVVGLYSRIVTQTSGIIEIVVQVLETRIRSLENFRSRPGASAIKRGRRQQDGDSADRAALLYSESIMAQRSLHQTTRLFPPSTEYRSVVAMASLGLKFGPRFLVSACAGVAASSVELTELLFSTKTLPRASLWPCCTQVQAAARVGIQECRF